ncbi:MASE1 domain-containing protein [Luteibacter sp. ME-Dv--P-043b]|uniref:MASE1 domain-containing protein n=1 Tax=Luteibacter sp. ME-Dv--P-043b TaxID=3040291 RepID=UPI0025557257|nr:MASE1 domain-containing protein [Luteibacter sp. ME-Dv--P-043b]
MKGGQHLAIAAAYAAVYEVVRHVTFPHWSPTTGLRLACLFLLPLRYWPALALGEALPTIENAWLAADDLGIPWAVSASVPMIVPFMAVMKPFRLRWRLYDDRRQLRMPLLLGATLACALISATLSCTTLATTMLRTPDAWPHLSLTNMFWAYTLGHFLGGLTLTPVILALNERARQLPRVTWATIWQSPLLRDVLLWVPVLAALVILAITTGDDTVRQVARFGLIWPAVALAWRHGWHGTAFGGFAASVALAITGTAFVDPVMLRAQVILALVLSGLLTIGAKVSRPLPTANLVKH